MSVSAQVAYLLPNGAAYDGSSLDGFPQEVQAEVAQNPELNAAEWFKATYVTSKNPIGTFLTPAEFVAQMENVKVLWIHIDRVADLSAEGAIDQFKADLGFDATFVAALKEFVANGGNLLLSKQATHLVGDMQRAGYPEIKAGGYIDEKVKWHVSTKFAERENDAHHIYARHQEQELGGDTKNEELAFLEDEGYVLHTDNNCGWGTGALGMTGDADYTNLAKWEEDNHARVIGTWGDCSTMPYAGMVEFYPYAYTEGEENYYYEGTVLCFGLAAYMWHTNNRGWGYDNIRHMTSCAIEYLLNEPTGAVDGSFPNWAMEDVLENAFFYPSVCGNPVKLHPVIENLQASYSLEDTDAASIQEIEEAWYLVFTQDDEEVTLNIFLEETRPFMNWTKGRYAYTRTIQTTAPTALENNSIKSVLNKQIQNGRLLIERNGVKYSATGANIQ